MVVEEELRLSLLAYAISFYGEEDYSWVVVK